MDRSLNATCRRPPRGFAASAIVGFALVVILTSKLVLADPNPSWTGKMVLNVTTAASEALRVSLQSASTPQTDDDYVQLLAHVHTELAGKQTQLGRPHAESCSSNALASCSTGVSNPSVNQL